LESLTLEGEIKGFEAGISVYNGEASKILTKIREKEAYIAKLKSDFKMIEKNIEEKESDLAFCLSNIHLTAKAGWFSYAAASFNHEGLYSITSVTPSQPAYLFDLGFFNENKKVQGKVYSSFWNDLDTTISIYTTNRIYFQNETETLKKKLFNSNSVLEIPNKELNSLLDEQRKLGDEHKKISSKIEDYKKTIMNLKRHHLTHKELETFIKS